MPDSSPLQTAAQRLNAGAYAEAAGLYTDAIRANPGQDGAWHGLVLALALQRQIGAIIGLADQRQKIRGDGFAFFNEAATLLMSYKLHPHAVELDRLLDDSSAYKASSLYYAACVHLLNSDEDAAFALFRRLKPMLAARRTELPIASEDRFNIVYRQTTLVEDGDYIAGLDRATLETAVALPAIDWPAEAVPNDARFILLAACDSHYFEMFAEDFLHSVELTGSGVAVHLHVAQPTDATRQLMTRLGHGMTRNSVRFSTEPAAAITGGAYFSCVRFLAASALRRRSALPLMITDIDIAFTRPPAEIAAFARDADFMSFEHDGFGPCSRLPAVLTWFGAGAEGTAALDALRAFILSKLHIPWPWNWMLDQAGLMALRRWLGQSRPAARIGRFNDAAGGSFDKVLACLGDEDRKAALIRGDAT
jgi:hypothetical protein